MSNVLSLGRWQGPSLQIETACQAAGMSIGISVDDAEALSSVGNKGLRHGGGAPLMLLVLVAGAAAADLLVGGEARAAGGI